MSAPTPEALLIGEGVDTEVVPEVAARRDLRAQIARLEARGARAPAVARGPRLLSLAELEALRDALTDRTSRMPRHGGANGTFDRSRARLEAMLAQPRAHKWERVSRAEAGLPGCGAYHVRPRLGLIGLLAGWWHVTLSSGCP